MTTYPLFSAAALTIAVFQTRKNAMAISSENRKTGIFTGDGKTTRYPFDFRILKTEHIAVITDDAIGNEHVLSEGRDYTAALETDGGHIDLAAPLGKGRRLVIVSNQPYLQPAVFTNHGGFYPANLNDALDKLVIQDQQIREQVGRALKVSVISSVNLTLPAPSPGKGIGWNADGSGLENNNYPEQAAASAERAEDAVRQAENEVKKVSAVLSGLKTVPTTFASIGLLRQAVKGDSPAAIVSSYHEGQQVGGGIFIADLKDKASADDGYNVIVDVAGVRWKRIRGVGDVVNFETRARFVASATKMSELPDGLTVFAGGYQYIKDAASQYIPDLPGWRPVNESFGHFDAKYAETGKSSVTTKYVNTDGLVYNVTYVSNIKPTTIRKYYSGLDKSTNTADLVTLRKAAAEKKYPSILLNSDVFFTTSNIAAGKTKIQGLQVVDNEIIRDFDRQDNRDALVMLRSGWLDVVKKSDNLSMEQIKNKGIAWSAYFGPTLIKDGSIPKGLPSDELSSRNVIGQKPNRDIVIIQVQGKTGKSGCTIQKAAELLLAEGCVFGFNLDGGGSTQMWWQDCYSFLSSDSDFSKERAVGGIIEIRADDTGIFDTGWQPIPTAEGISSADADLNIPAVCYRQVGAEIQLRISVSGNFAAGYKKVITTQPIPLRFTSVNFRDMRGMLVGADLSYGMWYAGNYLSLRAVEKSPYFTGTFKWSPRNSFTY